jgi:AAA family ATP:ADP antiporter
LNNVIEVKAGRWFQWQADYSALLWSFLYFFSLLCGYYVLRPIRDALGTQMPLRWLFFGTFLCMLAATPVYGALVARFPRRRFLPIVYVFFIVCLLGFYVLLKGDAKPSWHQAAFFIWVAVFNLFAVSVFWSFMSDIFDTEQAKRFYGFIAAGGTLGALAGPVITVSLTKMIGVPNLLLVSCGFLAVCVLAIFFLIPWARQQEQKRGWQSGEDAIGGSVLGGAKLILQSRFLQAASFYMFCGVAIGTLLYNEQRDFARLALPDPEQRTAYFARLDLIVNFTVLMLQLFVTRYVLRRFGPKPMLIVPVILVGIGFAVLTANPLPMLLSMVQIATRAGSFGLAQPARESLFTRVDREMRYKSKNFVDTVVYRGGDWIIAWVYTGMTEALHFGIGGVAVFGIFLSIAGLLTSIWIAREAEKLPENAGGAMKGAQSKSEDLKAG